MDLHANSALSWSGRRELARHVVDEGWTLTAAAEAAGVSVRCARKWATRYRDGDQRLLDRSSAPRLVANRTAPERVAVIVKLRRLRMTAAEIAETLGMPLSTVSGILTRFGIGRLGRLGLDVARRSGLAAQRCRALGVVAAERIGLMAGRLIVRLGVEAARFRLRSPDHSPLGSRARLRAGLSRARQEAGGMM